MELGNVHDVTVLVKQFFRELPEPLFTIAFHDAFVRCFNLNPDTRVSLYCVLFKVSRVGAIQQDPKQTLT
jgi:hypothetical protein